MLAIHELLNCRVSSRHYLVSNRSIINQDVDSTVSFFQVAPQCFDAFQGVNVQLVVGRFKPKLKTTNEKILNSTGFMKAVKYIYCKSRICKSSMNKT